MMKRCRLRKASKQPLKVFVDGKFHKSVYSPEEYENVLRDIGRSQHKVKLK